MEKNKVPLAWLLCCGLPVASLVILGIPLSMMPMEKPGPALKQRVKPVSKLKQLVKPVSKPIAKRESLSRVAHARLLKSKKKLTNADIPASWLREERPPGPSYMERRERQEQYYREEMALRWELARRAEEEAEIRRQRWLEERRVAALEAEAEALEILAWRELLRPQVIDYDRCERRRKHRADFCEDDENRYSFRNIGIHDSRGNYYWGMADLSGLLALHR